MQELEHSGLILEGLILVSFIYDHHAGVIALPPSSSFGMVQAAHGVEPGTHISVKSTSECVHVTFAYAAVTMGVSALLEWRDLVQGGGGEAYKRQLAAADAASVHTLVVNRLAVPAELHLDFGDHMCAYAAVLPILQLSEC